MTKKINKALAFSLLSLFLISLISCDKDDDINNDNNRSNQISYNGITYDLTWGQLMYDGSDNGLHFTSIALYPNSINYDPSSGRSGTGYAFWFEDIISSSSDIQGTYEAIDWDENTVEEAGLIGECEFNTNRTYPTETMEDEGDMYEFYDGTLKISKDGSDYIVEFDGKDSRGISVTLYYKGSLIE